MCQGRQRPRFSADTVGAWLWSGRNGVIAGRAAAALHGALWIDALTPIEMIWRSGRSPSGIVARNERIEGDEIIVIAGLPVTTPQRTAFDLARLLPRDPAVAHLDALARATGVTALMCSRWPIAIQEREALRRSRDRPRPDGRRCAITERDLGATVLIDGGLPATAERRFRSEIDGFRSPSSIWARRAAWWPRLRRLHQHRKDRDQYVYDIGRQSSSSARAGSTFMWLPNTVAHSFCSGRARRWRHRGQARS